MTDPDLRLLAHSQGALRADLDDLTHAVTTIDTAVADIARALTALANDTGPTAAPLDGVGPWTACGSDPCAHADAVDALGDWLAWAQPVLLAPRLGAWTLPDCWRHHPGAVEELLALHAAWLAAHQPTTPSDGPIAWHDRWLAPCLHRIKKDYRLDQCRRGHDS
jgi:hypothetical protein